MHRRFSILTLTLIISASLPFQDARAEITSLAASAAVEVVEFRAGQEGDRDQASDTYVGTSPLPLQVVAKLMSLNDDAIGLAAAQLADPRTASGPNPQEFAVDLTLSSSAADLYHTGRATLEEVRSVRFRPAEVGNAAAGSTVELLGRMYFDGVLLVFADPDVVDLSGVLLKLRVKVAKEADGQEPVQVFAGTLQLSGTTEAGVAVTADGQFPLGRVTIADLTAGLGELGVFQVVVLSDVAVEYAYEATVDEPFKLRATVEVDAAGIPGGVGVVALLGLPVGSLSEVVTLTHDPLLADALNTATMKERANPTGVPVLTGPLPPFTSPLALCGLLGLESLLGLFALVGLRTLGPWPRGTKRPRC